MSKVKMYKIYLEQNTDKEIHYFFSDIIAQINEFISVNKISEMCCVPESSIVNIKARRCLPSYQTAISLLDIYEDIKQLKQKLGVKYGY